MPGVRYRVVERLIQLNIGHARQAWEGRRRRDAIGPHVLVLLYAEPPTGTPPDPALAVAARLFLATDEPDPARLLYELTHIAGPLLRAGGDPCTVLASWSEDMSSRAVYLGLALSTLDTPAGAWAQVRHRAGSELDIPGRVRVHLRDDTRILLERASHRDFGVVQVRSTARVAGQPEFRRVYGLDPQMTDTDRVDWQWLGHLHHLVLRSSHAR